MVRLAIAGIGTIAKDYISLIMDGRITGVVLTALCSRSQENLDRVCAQYGISPAKYQNYEDLLQSGAADAVMICTPHGQHLSMASKAIAHGIHVLVEKPVGIFVDDGEALLSQLRNCPDLVCGVLFNRRASTVFRYIKNLMEHQTIGELIRCTWIITNLYRTDAYYQSSGWRGTWQNEGGGILMTQASHQLDLMQWLCGMPVSVVAQCATVNRKIDVENEAEMLFTYSNGAHGQFIASAHECPGTNHLEICGTLGRITLIEDQKLECVFLSEDERHFTSRARSPFEKVPYRVEHRLFDEESNKMQQASAIQNFVDAVQGKCDVLCSLEDGLRSLVIIHGAYMSQWKGIEIALPTNEREFRSALMQI